MFLRESTGDVYFTATPPPPTVKTSGTATNSNANFTYTPTLIEPISSSDLAELGGTSINYVTHGIVLYVAWFTLGFILLLSKRYIAGPPKLMFAIHAIAGYGLLIVTAVMSFKMIDDYDWYIVKDFHGIVGTIVLAGVFLVAVLGITRAITAKREPTPWVEKDNWDKVGKLHKISGFLLLILAQIACLSGLINYVQVKTEKEEGMPLILLTLPLYILILVILEFRHRYLNKSKGNEILGTKDYPIMTPSEVDGYDRHVHTLVILDNIVLDVHEFQDFHPGGKFLLKKNAGRDISKFFYGGYKMVHGKNS